MGKFPYMQFFPADHLRDTRALSCAAKGGWMDAVCMLQSPQNRGELKLAIVGWARIFGASVEQTEAIIAELETMKVADITRHGNGEVTIRSRRLYREANRREQTRLRVEHWRSNAACNDPGNGVETPYIPEARDQKPDPKPPSRSDPPRPAAAADGAESGDGELPLGTVDTNPSTDPVVFVFPTAGALREWPLRESKVKQWRVAYPGVDVDAALRELRQWCEDNPRRRKTAKGMTGFLSACLAKRQNNQGGGSNGGYPKGKAGFA